MVANSKFTKHGIDTRKSASRRMQVALNQRNSACPGGDLKERSPIRDALNDGRDWFYSRAVRVAGFLSLLVLAACAVTQPERGFEDIESVAADRLKLEGGWVTQFETSDQRPIDKNTTLDVETAIHFALLQHPRMKAAFAELGIARADLMKAGLLPNPVIELGAEIPDRSPQGMAIEFNILGSVVDLLLRPDNTRIKALAVDAAIIRFSAELMDFAAKVETAFVRLQGARHRHTLLREIDADARASADLAAEMRKTGNVAAVHAVRTAALAEQSGVHLLRAALAVDEAQAELSLLMGMGDPSDLPLGEALLPSLPSTPIRVEDALAIALTERLDLASARKAVEVEAAKHQISVDWGWLNAVQIGVSAERDTDRQFRIGPRLQADLPIFNRGQAERAQTAATLRRQQHGVETLALEIESQVRLAERRVQQTHSIAKKYEDKLLPLHEQIGALIQRQKDFMLIGTTDVVAARRDALMVSREYVHALGDYWIAVAELRRALGGRAITTE